MSRPLLPAPLRNLISHFERLPGVGPKSAQRIVLALLHRPKDDVERFADDLKALGATKVCATCGMLAEAEQCGICADSQRDRETLCVVETPVDVIAIERTGQYQGRYHVLGGVLSPLERIGPEQLNLASLLRRVKTEKPAEIILALNPSTEGDTTALYLQDKLARSSARITRLAQGLPTGAALEFADDLTIARALAGRREIRKESPVAVSARSPREASAK